MKIPPFETEHFYAKYEFITPHQLCNSDCETVTIAELLQMANISLSELGNLTLGYTESQGHPQLRMMIANAHPNVAADDLIILGTPVEGIYLAARAILEPSDEVIVLTPAYDALINMFEHVVGKPQVKKWSFSANGNRWQLDFDQLQQLISPQTKLLVVNFPHNPTGFSPTPKQLNELIGIAEQNGIWLFCDEMYFGLMHSGAESIPSAAELSEQAIVLSGLSKTYGLPGLRTGWLMVRDNALRQNLINWKFYTSICPPAPSEFLAMAAWQVRNQLRDKNIAQIEANLAEAELFFDRWPELFDWKRPYSGSTALVGMNVPSVTQLAETLAAEAGVLIHPATTLGGTDQQMRLGFGRAGFTKALARFEQFLPSLPKS